MYLSTFSVIGKMLPPKMSTSSSANMLQNMEKRDFTDINKVIDFNLERLSELS